jgi:hypothetical protein
MKNVNNKNLKNDYLENLSSKIISKHRFNDLYSWIKNNEKDKYIYYKDNINIIKKCISGGIIIENENNWIKIFDKSFNTSLIIYDGHNNYNMTNIISIPINDLNENNIIINQKWNRIIFDITNLKCFITNKYIFKLHSNNRWIHINKLYNKDILNYLKIILNDDKINTPLYKNEELNLFEYFDENTTQINNINKLIKINKLKYDLKDYDKLILNYYNYDILDSIKLFSLINKKNIQQNDLDCPICLNIVKNNIFYTNCSHHFCIKCLIEWLSKNKNCPLCRQTINIQKLLLHNMLNDIDEKTNLLFNKINNLMNTNKKIVVYSSNNDYYHYVITLIDNNLIELYNKYTKNINFINNNIGCLFIRPEYSNFIVDIRGITNIIIIDNNYKNIIKRESLGHDSIYENKLIEIDIIEINE